jgi:M6 family metalloprotease-like protein
MTTKKTLQSLVFLCLTGSLLSSCFFLHYMSSSTSTVPSSYTSGGNTIYTSGKTDSSFSKDNLNKDNIGLGNGYRYLPSTGNSKVLVIPVQFSDDSFTTVELERMANGFFGAAADTGWESLTSYYQKASYGKLTISGEVTSPVTVNQSKSEFANAYASASKSDTDYTAELLESTIKSFVTNKKKDFSDYDSNKDGYLDAIWMVYSAPFVNSSSNSNPYWAYTTWDTSGVVVDETHNLRTCLYSWASVDFLTEKQYSLNSILENSESTNADMHTFIHETGHMMGLDDYYSYDYGEKSSTTGKTNYDTPVGGVDMMDFNIGGHCAYSRYFLGWITPTVITDDYLSAHGNALSLAALEATSATDPQAYLIPSYANGSTVYNGTPFDEFLLVEYYTPTSLNLTDTKGYTNGLSTYPTKGVVIYHINAKIGKMVANSQGDAIWNGQVFDSLPLKASTSAWGKNYLYTYIYSNTRSYCYDTDISDTSSNFYRGRLISLLSATGYKIEGKKTGYADSTSLFRDGSTFLGSSGIYTNFVFDNGTKPEYGFSVSSLTNDAVTLTFNKL